MLIYSRTYRREERGKEWNRQAEISRPGVDSFKKREKKRKKKKYTPFRSASRYLACATLQVLAGVRFFSLSLSSPHFSKYDTRRRDSRSSRPPESLKEVI